MAQTRKQLNNQLTVAKAQLAVHNHETRRTLNERVHNTEQENRKLTARIDELLKQIENMQQIFETHKKQNQEYINTLLIRIEELESQVLGIDSK